MSDTKMPTKGKLRVLLFDPCGHTALGLARLCENELKGKVVGMTQSLPNFLSLTALGKADMVICGVDDRPDTVSRLLTMTYHPTCHYVLFTACEAGAISRTLRTAGFYTAINKDMPLGKLSDKLQTALVNSRAAAPVRTNRQLYCPEERYILGALLRGERPDTIARTMGISYRSVSRYKHTALRRAGLNNINEILLSLPSI